MSSNDYYKFQQQKNYEVIKMKIFGCRINLRGITLPSGKHITLFGILVGALAVFYVPNTKTLVREEESGALLPVSEEEGCAIPPGSYLESCEVLATKRLQGTGSKFCKVDLSCKHIYEALNPKKNALVYPLDFGFLNEWTNNNGTVEYKGVPLAAEGLPDCLPPNGSYLETCKVTTGPYVSKDAELARSLCRLDAICEKLDKTNHSTTLHFPHYYKPLARVFSNTAAVITFENCDGNLIISTSGEDSKCKKKSPMEIQQAADKHSPLGARR
jgi:hypothetical protein